MRTAEKCFPDGTPMEKWFGETEAPELSGMGPACSLAEAGIRPDGRIHTAEIQALIDRMHENGGGVLVIPAGTWMSGALFFRPGVHLYAAEGAMLLGSDDPADYPVTETRIEGESCLYLPALINADRCDGFTLFGPGTIDGNGLRSWKAFWQRRSWNPECTNKDEQRPRLVFISNSRNVTLSGIRLQNAAFWTSHVYRCQYVKYLNCSFYSPYEPVKAPSTDAIDIDACTDVLVKGCEIHVNDDGVALKGGKGPWADRQPENGSNERILIEDCHYAYSHGCLTLGSEAVHCRNVILRRIRVDDGFNLLWLKFRPDTPQLFEYITVEDVSGKADNFLNVHKWTQFFNPGERTDVPPSVARHITMRRCEVTCDTYCQAPEDLTGYELSDFRLENLRVDYRERGNTGWIR